MAFKRKEYHKEENCLNCDYPLVGSFCGHCGQKAFLHKDSFLHMVAHFAGDYFHYDSKFWRTIKTLFTKPGLVTLEYNAGKRAKYLNPIQLYIFVTTVFFLLAFSFSNFEQDFDRSKNELKTDSLKQTQLYNDSLRKNGIGMNNKGELIFNFSLAENGPISLAQYDSIQRKLPDSSKDGSLIRYMQKKKIRYGGSEGFSEKYLSAVVHNIPKLFFLLLPFFSLLLLLVNYRKKIYYIDHIIFSLHIHSVLFLVLIFLSLLGLFISNFNAAILIGILAFIGMSAYQFVAFKRVYPGSFLKVFVKQGFLAVTYFFGFLFALIALFVLSIFLM